MANERHVKGALEKFTRSLKDANNYVEDVLQTVRELEEALETYDADADLKITRGIKGEIDRGKKQIQELRKNVDKLDRELSDTNRIYQKLRR
jgi:flagellar biosynthesis chaperone FliJ